MAISFRKREATEKIVVLIKDTAFVDYKSYYKYCRCQGELDIAFTTLWMLMELFIKQETMKRSLGGNMMTTPLFILWYKVTARK